MTMQPPQRQRRTSCLVPLEPRRNELPHDAALSKTHRSEVGAPAHRTAAEPRRRSLLGPTAGVWVLTSARAHRVAFPCPLAPDVPRRGHRSLTSPAAPRAARVKSTAALRSFGERPSRFSGAVPPERLRAPSVRVSSGSRVGPRRSVAYAPRPRGSSAACPR